MRIALIADAFPPLRTSAAVQMRDLAREFLLQGHTVSVLLPSANQQRPWVLEKIGGIQVLRLRAPRMKDIGYIRRTVAELLMPFFMRHNLLKSPLGSERWDGIVWYSPSIFHGPLVNSLKKANGCEGYLIIRDIFPEWAVDMGLMGRGLPYWFFDRVARYQYSLADVIGVQTPGNLAYFKAWSAGRGRKLEVLQNWLEDVPNIGCTISLEKTSLVGRKIFVYAGNMGLAQGTGILLDLAEMLRGHTDLGFLFIGRGSDARELAIKARARDLNNVLFHDEIHPDEIPGLYAQCAVGLVALDPRHKSHNIPGKFLTYMQAGLPVLANLNPGNDLAEMIRNHSVGRVSEDNKAATLAELSLNLIETLGKDLEMKVRCRNLYNQLFMPRNAVKQIVAAFTKTRVNANV